MTPESAYQQVPVEPDKKPTKAPQQRYTMMLDIETVPRVPAKLRPAYERLARRSCERRRVAYDEEEFSRYVSLSPLLATIVCVGIELMQHERGIYCIVQQEPFPAEAIADVERWKIATHVYPTERQLLEYMNKLLAWSIDCVVTFNGRRFDMPCLHHRMIANGIRPCQFLGRVCRDHRYNKRPLNIDLLEELSFHGVSGYLSLEEACLAWTGEDPKAGGSGKDVRTLVAAGEVEKVCSYCMGDVGHQSALYQIWHTYMREAGGGQQ